MGTRLHWCSLVDSMDLAYRNLDIPYASRHDADMETPFLLRRSALTEPLAMARNIEIKARIESVEALEPKVAKIADSGPTELFQDDTFFQCEAGRLKLRAFSESHGELIFYKRSNQTGPKESFYVRSQTMALLGIEPSQLVEGAYVDLLGETVPTSKPKSW